jgi:3-keto-disaccharide hydrolase
MGDETTVKGFQEEHQAGSKWFIHDPERPQPRAVEPGPSSTLCTKPPEGAVLLFDGTDASGWTGGPWRIADGEVNGTGSIRSKAEFGDGRLHVEFAIPAEVKGVWQDRGNGGVFLMGCYEVQVLDNWKAATYADGMVGAVYGQNPPSVNASRPPGEWQTYDITFTAPRFDEKGAVLAPARITVRLNGVKYAGSVGLW